MSSIPESWMRVTLKDVGSITTGNTPPTKQTDFYGGSIPFVKPGDLDAPAPIVSTQQTLTEHGARQARLLRAGTVLVSCIGNLGKVGLAGVPLTTNQQINAIEFAPRLVDDRYGYHYCKTLREWMGTKASATTVTILNKSKFAEAPFLLAPLNEQKRIADKLDALLARVDACRERLDRVPLILKRFRQAVLAAATAGRLTADDETDQPEHLLLSEVIERLKTGPFGSALHKADYVSYGIPIVNPMHINGGRITPTHDMTLTREKADELKEFRLVRGDIVLARRGVMGRCAVVSTEQDGWLCGSGSMLLHPTDRVLPEYLQIFLSSPDIAAALEANLVGSTMSNLNQGILLGLRIRVPNVRVQYEIVRRVEALLTYAERVEACYQTARAQVERLTPSLLAKAFCGELVPQDPDDEPAPVLLERIRAAQEAQPTKPKRVSTPRKPEMTKMTTDSARKAIQQFPTDTFSFDELRKAFPGNYDSLKDIVFALLDESDPSITQVFDQDAKTMRFVRRHK